MRLRCREVAEWPPLAWLARCTTGQDTVAVYHGSRVERADEWFAEAV